MLKPNFIDSFHSFIEKINLSMEKKKKEKHAKQIKEATSCVLNQIEISLQYDHPNKAYHSNINDFTDKYLNSGLIDPNTKFTFDLSLYHHFNDVWKEHNLTKRFYKLYEKRVEGGSFLHLAALLSSEYMVNSLINLGANLDKQDVTGKTAKDVLFFNQNYITKEAFDLLENKLDSNKNIKKLKL